MQLGKLVLSVIVALPLAAQTPSTKPMLTAQQQHEDHVRKVKDAYNRSQQKAAALVRAKSESDLAAAAYQKQITTTQTALGLDPKFWHWDEKTQDFVHNNNQ
jgi:geranylgeranyl pyrophosphate synthase